MNGRNTDEGVVGASLGINVHGYTDNIKAKPALPHPDWGVFLGFVC